MSEKISFVEDLLSKMTLEEKVAQMIQVPVAMVSMEEARKWAERGVGSFLHVLGDDARELQKIACSSRLGIPVIFGIDAIHGHGLNKDATIFPSQLAMAASWNKELVKKIGRATAEEVSTDGLHWTFSPVLCLGRDTRWGRVDETFGEDPYLSGEMGEAIIKGYQGEKLSDDTSILACAKHYIGYGEAVGARDACDTEITYRKMKETFLPPFKKAVEAGCATFMTAYGSIDGRPFTIDKKSLHDILRDEVGFEGFVVTDWDNVNSLVKNQKVCKDVDEASRLSAIAGNDMIMTSIEFYDSALKEVREGRLDESVIDEACRHILNVKYKMGLFQKAEKGGKPGCIGSKEHQKIALDAARKSVALLKNNGLLPLDKSKVRKIAVIGPNADDVRAQYGDWTYFTHPIPGMYREPVRPYVTLLEGVKKVADEACEKGCKIEVSYAYGCPVSDKNYFQGDLKRDDLANNDKASGDFIPTSWLDRIYANYHDVDPSAEELKMIEEAKAAAKGADVILFAIGDNYNLTGEMKDRGNLELTGQQLRLFNELKTLGIPIVTILIASKPLVVTKMAQESDAFICAFNGGMFAGQALAEVVFGDIEPSGRLPISFPYHSGQLPIYYNYLPGWHGGRYVDLPQGPLFAFGEGLGYSDFEYSDLKFDAASMIASVRVKNLGKRDSTETVQIYVHDLVASVMQPVKSLAAFAQVDLKAGEERLVEIKVPRDAFTLVLPDESTVLEPGDFEIMAGHSSKDNDLLKVTVTL